MTFTKGEYIVCIDNRRVENFLTNRDIYEVIDFYPGLDGVVIENDNGERYIACSDRFMSYNEIKKEFI